MKRGEKKIAIKPNECVVELRNWVNRIDFEVKMKKRSNAQNTNHIEMNKRTEKGRTIIIIIKWIRKKKMK